MNLKLSVIMSISSDETEINYINSIKSILNQTINDFEFIIILDGKDLPNIPRDDRIVLLKNEKRMGLAYSLNRAIDLAKGDFLARQDSDDISVSNRLEIQYNCLINNDDLDLVGSDTFFINSSNNIIGRRYTPLIHKDLIAKKFSQIEVPHPTWMFKKEWIKKIGKYKNLMRGQDQYLLITNSDRNKYYNISKPLIYYRVKNINIKSLLVGRLSTIKANLKISIKSFLLSMIYHPIVFIFKDLNFLIFGNKIYDHKKLFSKDVIKEQEKLNNLISKFNEI